MIVAANQTAEIKQTTIFGQNNFVGGGESLTLDHSTLKAKETKILASNINSDSTKIEGEASFEAQKILSLHNLDVQGNLQTKGQDTSFSGSTTAHSLITEGDHLKNTGELEMKDSLKFKGKVVEQLGTTRTGKSTEIEATEQYIDTETSRNESKGNLAIIAENNRGFKGHQIADTAVIKLRDMDLLRLLNQTDARVIKAYLREAVVILNDDLLVKNTLHLWAHRLENRAKLTINGDFLAHIQSMILNWGIIRAIQDLRMITEGPLVNFGTMEGNEVFLKSKQFISERLVQRQYSIEGYKDVLQNPAIIQAHIGSLNIETDDFRAICTKFKAKLDVKFKSSGNLYLGAQTTSSDTSTSSKHSKTHTYTEENHKTEIEAGRDIGIQSDQDMECKGVRSTAGRHTDVTVGGTFKDRAVTNVKREEHQRTKKGGFLRKKTTKSNQSETITDDPNLWNSGGNNTFQVTNNAHLQAPQYKSGGTTTVRSTDGKLIFEEAYSSTSTQEQKMSKSHVWQSFKSKWQFQKSLVMPSVDAKGGFVASGAKGIEVPIRKNGDLSHSLDTLEKGPNKEWVNALRKMPNVIWRLIEEEHYKKSCKVQGPTAGAAIVTTITISMLTGGAGAALGFTGVMEAVVSATVSTLSTQATLSLASNKGDPLKALKEMRSSKQLRSLGINVATAAVTQGLAQKLNLPSHPKGFFEHLKVNAVHTGVSTSFSIALQDQDLEKVLIKGLTGIATGTLGGWGANIIAKGYASGEIDPVIHKLLHITLGVGMGAISDKDWKRGALSGGIGGLAETIAHTIMPEYEDFTNQDDYETAKQRVGNISILTSAALAFLLRQNVDVANITATNAIENNLLFPSPYPESEKAMQENADAFMRWATTDNPEMAESQRAHLSAIENEITDLDRRLSSSTLSSETRKHLTERKLDLLENREIMSGLPITPLGIAFMTSTYLPMARGLGEGSKVGVNLTKEGAKVLPRVFSRWGSKTGGISIAKVAPLTLKTPKTVKHHVFNKFRGESTQSQKYRDFFAKHAIDIDAHTIEVTDVFHRNKIHIAGNNWTTKWKQWIDANPNASTKEVYQFGGQLMDEYGVSHIPLVNYRK